MKKLPFFLLLFCLLLIPAETQAWQGEDNSEANTKAHEAANCILLRHSLHTPLGHLRNSFL